MHVFCFVAIVFHGIASNALTIFLSALCLHSCHPCKYYSQHHIVLRPHLFCQKICDIFQVSHQCLRIIELGFNFLNKIIVSLSTLRPKSPCLDFSIDVSIHIRTKDLVARGFKIIELLRAEI